MKKVMLFGGTFDPIHYGHLNMMKVALKQTGCDEGWFLLADQAPLKDSHQLSFELRLGFIQTMIEPFNKLKVCTIEKELPKPNYTINTLKSLINRYPNYAFNLLIGTDQAEQFNQWQSFEEILTLADVFVYPRSSEKINPQFHLLEGEIVEVSSSAIRQGLSVKTHPYILRQIIYYGLYAHELLSTYLKPARMNHSFMVGDLMKELAQHYKLDAEYYYGLGIIHDLLKEKEKNNQLEPYLTEADKKKSAYALHAVACSNLLKWHYKIIDNKFTDAIYHHVTGQGETIEAKLLYIADKCERTRGFNSEPLIELTKFNIDLGFKAVKERSYQYQKEKGVTE